MSKVLALAMVFWLTGCAWSHRGSTVATPTPLIVSPSADPSPKTQPSQSASQFQVIDLNAPAPSLATSVNNAGVVVGEAQTGQLTEYNGQVSKFETAFLWSQGAFQSIAAPSPNPSEDFSASVAYDANAKGEIVGGVGSYSAGPMDGLMFCEAFIYNDGTVSEPLNSPREVKESEQAFGVNEVGTLVGSEAFHGFVYTKERQIEIPPLSTLEEGNGTVGVAVNNKNEVVGATATGSSEPHPKIHAFLWRTPGVGRLVDLGTLPGFRNSIAVAINDHEAIVGYTTQATADDAASGKWIGNRDPTTLDFDELPRNGHAFLWKAGVMHDLGVLGSAGLYSAAFGINNDGIVVGWAGDRAVMWVHGVILDLNVMIPKTSGWKLLQARAINDRGWIVGQGTLNGEKRAFLLVPGSKSAKTL